MAQRRRKRRRPRRRVIRRRRRLKWRKPSRRKPKRPSRRKPRRPSRPKPRRPRKRPRKPRPPRPPPARWGDTTAYVVALLDQYKIPRRAWTGARWGQARLIRARDVPAHYIPFNFFTEERQGDIWLGLGHPDDGMAGSNAYVWVIGTARTAMRTFLTAGRFSQYPTARGIKPLKPVDDRKQARARAARFARGKRIHALYGFPIRWEPIKGDRDPRNRQLALTAHQWHDFLHHRPRKRTFQTGAKVRGVVLWKAVFLSWMESLGIKVDPKVLVGYTVEMIGILHQVEGRRRPRRNPRGS